MTGVKCTDNRRRGRRRRLSKRERRRRALIRLMRRILAILFLIVIALIAFKFFGNGTHKAADFEEKTYNKAYHKEELFASSLCVLNLTDNKELSGLSTLKDFTQRLHKTKCCGIFIRQFHIQSKQSNNKQRQH